ncbi:flagella basal body P-ring formation protein FlgA [candidate division WOR-1 bacterium RIFCSPHIGHO2_01_FULL_53_15]|uniref:Flagella basal body P-ring formation protein FlgA n=1 Tax=candidate division WOR-1 bacterium RIFCSPHIGHO2_01_FULL_53_15 TaxID=1802564 RepID=A0A1F4Q2V1_UNCSA|nr:MAG: flagella basal body P-ring formation protein FlgA [candidate division WOR-1 bacterium RIFCSPHIGHO2_01_FULL_53_15]OGC10376.1 MAG: flagella basal body P-ring formation protein FlgA [candidate division WOR-1 bacterium RIFCSPHIGHO2_02_FULL_53_26]
MKFLAGLLLAFSLSLPAFALAEPEQKTAEVIKNYVAGKYPGWTKEDIRPAFRLSEGVFGEMKGLPEETKLSVIEVYPDFKPVGSVIFPILAAAGEESRKFMVRAKVEVVKKIAAAARLIKKGKKIESADIKLEERDIALLPQKYFTGLDPLINKEAKIAIPQNSTVFEWMVGDVPLVRRGEQVNLLVTAPGLVVKTKALAQEDGGLGAEIKVRRLDANKILSAKVVSASEVEVKLQ